MTAWRVRGITAGGGGAIGSSSVCGSAPATDSHAMLWAISRRARTSAVAATTFPMPTPRTLARAGGFPGPSPAHMRVRLGLLIRSLRARFGGGVGRLVEEAAGPRPPHPVED